MRILHWATRSVGLLILGIASCTTVEALDATPDGGPKESGTDAPAEGGALQGTMQCGSIPVASDDCARCADDHCCSAGEACADNDACVALRDCLAACPAEDEGCADSCSDANPQGAADNAVLSACRLRWCSVECFKSTGGECGFRLSPSSCNDCAQNACCDVGWVANTQPSFWGYQDCVAACGDSACFDACAADNPEGRNYYMAFVGCVGTYCAAGCGLKQPATCGGFYGAACGTCVSDNCCDASLDCLLDPACQKLRACAQGCGGDDDCISACEQTSPEVVDAHAALDACLTVTCAGVCP